MKLNKSFISWLEINDKRDTAKAAQIDRKVFFNGYCKLKLTLQWLSALVLRCGATGV